MRTALQDLGGVAPTADVVARCSRRRVRTALARGDAVRLGPRRLALPDVGWHRRRAAELNATVSHLSAAQVHGWPVWITPESPWLVVPRHRNPPGGAWGGVEVFHADLREDEEIKGVTAPLRTVLDCARALPFVEALAVADSALRAGDVDSDALRISAAAARGPGSAGIRRVAEAAHPRAANPFESATRALALEAGLDVVPQVPVRTRTMTFEPDLVDVSRRVVVEADSWGWHSERDAHERDYVRHTALALAGWLLLRFTWHQVRHSPSYVRAVLDEVAARGDAGA